MFKHTFLLHTLQNAHFQWWGGGYRLEVSVVMEGVGAEGLYGLDSVREWIWGLGQV